MMTYSLNPDDDDILELDRRGEGRTLEFLGVEFACLPTQALIERLVMVASRKDGFRYIATPNVDHIVGLTNDPARKSLYKDAWANVCDSRILEVLAKASGLALPVTAGSDLTARLFEEVIDPNETVVIVGGQDSVITALNERFGLKDVRWHEPPMGLRSNPQAIAQAADFVAHNPSRFVFLCVGAPQQEMLAQAIKAGGKATGLGLCVGASLDFLAGKVERAPVWMQNARLEWLHRLMSEPQRMWKRYLVEGPKIFGIWRSWEAARKATGPQAPA
jgi:N-acetylglucosaminyldiphosphoundecaprenol N-acetyl-beta-D-mannosaminyltransferase